MSELARRRTELGGAPGSGTLRPAVRARRLRRRLRRRHQGPQVQRDRPAGDPGPAEPRPPRRLRLRGQHRRRRRHPDPDAARVLRRGSATSSKISSPRRANTARARCSCRRSRQPRGVRAPFEQIVREEGQASSAGAPCRPTTLARRDGARVAAVHPPGLHRPARRRARCRRRDAGARRPGFERKLYVIRKRAYSEIRTAGDRRRASSDIPSLSSRRSSTRACC